MRRFSPLFLLALPLPLLLLGCPDDGVVDDDDDTTGPSEDCEDADGDGYRDGPDCPTDELLDCNDADAKLNWDDEDNDGTSTCGQDCDDDDPTVFPDNAELCDGLDNDCDELIDEDFENDGDGYYDGNAEGCDEVYDADNLDCDDADPEIYPGADEECDGEDNDCDGVADEDFDVDGDGWTTCGGDCLDGDAAINPDATEVCDNLDNNCDGTVDDGFDADGDGWTTCGGDCDDGDASIYVGAPELCDGLDNDCDSFIDEDFDLDGDGVVYGPNGECDSFLAPDDQDCDDSDPNHYPGAPELCDGLDNDCDGEVDEGAMDDDDGDGFSECDGDCDDGDANIGPGATELCDGIDNNCDGTVDEGYDLDGDGWTECGGDCDDTDATVYPAATELPDGQDNDCDGAVDETNYCNTWDPIEAIGAEKVYDVTYPMFGSGTETVTIEQQTTYNGADAYQIHGSTDFGLDFDYYAWCDPADGAVWKLGMEATVSGMSIEEIEDPARRLVRAADEVGVITSWTENFTVGYYLYLDYDFETEADFTDLGLETITVAGTTYDALHIHVDYLMVDIGMGYVGDVSGTQDMWFVEDIGIVRFWYTLNNSMLTGGIEETLFTKEMVSVTMP